VFQVSLRSPHSASSTRYYRLLNIAILFHDTYPGVIALVTWYRPTLLYCYCWVLLTYYCTFPNLKSSLACSALLTYFIDSVLNDYLFPDLIWGSVKGVAFLSKFNQLLQFKRIWCVGYFYTNVVRFDRLYIELLYCHGFPLRWNNLPKCCINGTTINNLKSHIHKVLEPETK